MLLELCHLISGHFSAIDQLCNFDAVSLITLMMVHSFHQLLNTGIVLAFPQESFQLEQSMIPVGTLQSPNESSLKAGNMATD